MKYVSFLILLTSMIFTFSSCKEQTEFAEFDQALITERLNNPDDKCQEFSKDATSCDAIIDCQGLYSENESFLSCIPLDVDDADDAIDVVIVEEEGEEEIPTYEAEPTLPPVTPYVGEEENEEEKEAPLISCGNNKVIVCHYPQGNLDNGKSLCINIHGFDHGHKDRHIGDHLGACSQSDLSHD